MYLTSFRERSEFLSADLVVGLSFAVILNKCRQEEEHNYLVQLLLHLKVWAKNLGIVCERCFLA